MLTADPGGSRRWVSLAPTAAGAVIIGVTAARAHAADPIGRTLERLRIGTFQTDSPTVTTGTATGLWICLGAGVLLLVAGIVWLAFDRPADGRTGRTLRTGQTGQTGQTGAEAQ
ncbi:hypothetical protein [Parafrankia sp. FMc2]|uniref:hypothetical protein n=1 Tax=Parafrankia sp. FMc2 TaxID=3233196 RepID=UPI0034D4D623